MRLLIVDDEKNTRNVLRDYLPWEELGITAIAEAKDGKEALDLALHFHPNLVLCDIKMPRMNGLEFAAKYKSINTDCKFIFLSAYSDREYLNKAIKLRAISYVEKPVKLSEIQEAAESAIKEFNEFRTSRKINEAYVKRKSILSCIHGDCSMITEQFPDFFADNSAFISVYTRQFPADSAMGTRYSAEDFEDFFSAYALSHLQERHSSTAADAEELMRENFLYSCTDPEHLILFIKLGDGLNMEFLINLFKSFKENTDANFPEIRNIYIGLSSPKTGSSSLLTAYKEAKARRKCAFFGDYGFDTHIVGEAFSFTELFVKNALESFEFEDKEKLISTAAELYSVFSAHCATSEDKVKGFYLQLIFTLYQRAKLKNNHIFVELYSSYVTAMGDCSDLLELNLCLNDSINHFFIAEKSPSLSNMVEKTKNYILENYGKGNLSISMIASNIYLSPNYISLLFKKETGTTVNQFITDIRMKKAKELLRDDRLTLAIISVMVGFHDSNYFSKVFKRECGMSPKTYREHIYDKND